MVKAYTTLVSPIIALLIVNSFSALHPTNITVTVLNQTKNIDYSPDHKFLAMNSPTELQIVISQTGAIYQNQVMNNFTLSTFAFNKDSTWLALGSKNGQTKLYQNNGTQFVDSSKEFISEKGSQIVSLCFTPDNNFVVAGYLSDEIIAWKISDGTKISTNFSTQLVQSGACSPTDPTLVVFGGGINTASKLTFFNIDSQKNTFVVLKDIVGMGCINGVAFNGDGSKLFRSDLSEIIEVFDKTGVSVENITAPGMTTLFKVRVTSNSRIIATNNDTHAVFLTLDSTDMLSSYTPSAPVKISVPAVALSGEGDLAFYVDNAGTGTALGECDIGNFSDGNGGCVACDANCTICDSKPDQCYSCSSKFYLDGATCVGCPTGCATCTGADTCQTCEPKFVIKNNLCECQPGTYQSGTVCLDCGIGCDVCVDDQTCTTCNPEFDLNAGVCKCKAGTFLNNKTCSTCVRGCSQCQDATTCDVCDDGNHYIKNGNNTCECDAASNFVDNGTNCTCKEKTYLKDTTCDDCPKECKVCLSLTNCTSCEGSLVIRNDQCKCPKTDEWVDPDTLACTACKDTLDYCIECDKPDVCNTCEAGLNRDVKNGKCQCITGYYEDNKVCTKCTLVGCSDCSAADVCITCDTARHWELDSATNQCKCNKKYYQNVDQCIQCSLGCQQCTSPQTCTKCDAADHWVDDGNNACKCEGGYYQDANSTCSICMAGCLNCTGIDACDTCDEANGFVKDDNNICVCSDQQHLIKDRQCVPCSTVYPHCDTCLQDSCTTCLAPYMNNDTICMCNNGDFDDGTTCQACPLGCTLCSAADHCTGCVAGDTYYFKDFHCIPCTTLPHCITCISQTDCHSCADPFKLDGTICICESGKFIDGEKCSTCPEGCTACDSKDYCTACNENEGYRLEDGECLKSGAKTLVVVLIVVGVIVMVGAVFVVIKCIKKRRSPLSQDDYEKL